MKIHIVPYNPDWKRDFEQLREELEDLLRILRPRVEHIGSTSVEGLSAKPVIDVLIGTKTENDLDQTVDPLMRAGYVYYEKYNSNMPYRRYFVKLKNRPENLSLPGLIREGDKVPALLNDHALRRAHIHIIPESSVHWLRHIAFREYLRAQPDLRERYQTLKKTLGTRDWTDGNAYNEAKDAFLKTEEQNALAWYTQQNESHP